MKNLLFLLLIITAIEFNLQWNGIEHQPNWVKAWDNNQEVQIEDNWTKIGNVYSWNVYDVQGNLITFLNFWTTY